MKRLLVTMLIAVATLATARAQWTQTAGPEGGKFTSMAATDDALLIATWNGTIYRMAEAGEWEQVAELGRMGFFTVGDDFLAGTEQGLLRSTDRGTTWIPTARDRSFATLAVDGSALYGV